MTRQLAAQFGVENALPGTLLIDREGKIADLHLGLVNKDVFKSETKKLLNESAKKDGH